MGKTPSRRNSVDETRLRSFAGRQSRAQKRRSAQLLMAVKATIFDLTQIDLMNLDASSIGSAA
jgi:hypothetical protein